MDKLLVDGKHIRSFPAKISHSNSIIACLENYVSIVYIKYTLGRFLKNKFLLDLDFLQVTIMLQGAHL